MAQESFSDPSCPDSIRRWSSDCIAEPARLDYWMSIIRDSLWPVSHWEGVTQDLSVQIEEARLGPLSTVLETICAHRARRTRNDVDRSAERSYQLFMSLRSPWGVEHQGCHERLAPGDVVLLGDGEHQTDLPQGFHGLILKCPVGWIRTWLPDPDPLLGKRIRQQSRWGRVLSPLMSQLTPQLAAAPPLPHAVLTDQLGTVLALMAGDEESGRDAALAKQIIGLIRERCREPALCAAQVAATLDIPASQLHRTLAARGTSFAGILLERRTAIALDLLTGASCRSRSSFEIAQLAGFSNMAHFTRILRAHSGLTPDELRTRCH